MTNTSLLMPTAAELLETDPAARPDLLAPLLAPGTVALVYGPPGIGKSFFALGIAWAVAAGGSFLGWQSPRPHRVLHVDGGLRSAALRERLGLFGPPPATLRLCPLDLASGPVPDLSRFDGLVRVMDAWVERPALMVLDAPSGRGEAESWDGVQRFLQYQRMEDRAVLLVDRANKEGALQGNAGRAHDVDLVIALRRPKGGDPSRNARFEIHVEKAQRRDASLSPILAELEADGWRWGPADDPKLVAVTRLLKQGLSAIDAAAALRISRSALYERKAKAKEKGLLT